MRILHISIVSFLFILALSVAKADRVGAEDYNGDLEERLLKVEQSVETIPSTLLDYSEDIRRGLDEYTTKLEGNLENFSRELQIDVENKIRAIDKETVLLNPASKNYQRIETNTGTFLIAIEKMEKIENGFKLHLQIGNPNYADFHDIYLRLFWGKAWTPQSSISYEEWRGSLAGAEYRFPLRLEKGTWTPVKVELIPATTNTLGYIECAMEVASIELKKISTGNP